MLLDVSLYVMHIELQLVHKRHSKFCVQRMHKCINKPLMTLQKLRCESIGRNKGVNERRSSLRLRGCAQVLRLAWHGAPDWCVGSRHTWQLVEGGVLDQRWNRIRSKGARMTNPRRQRDCPPTLKVELEISLAPRQSQEDPGSSPGILASGLLLAAMGPQKVGPSLIGANALERKRKGRMRPETLSL